MIGITRDKKKKNNRYYHMKADISEHCCLCSIDVDNIMIDWTDNDQATRGEQKKSISDKKKADIR